MLDNLDAQRIDRFWSRLQSAATDQVDEIVKECFTAKKSSEEQFIISFARRAQASRDFHRFSILGMSKPDIPEYLPVSQLVPGVSSWEALRMAFDAQSKIGSFKPWLKQTFGVEYTDELLIAACESLDSIPHDFHNLLSTCLELGKNVHLRKSRT